jgi:hypothetical protein
MDDVVGMGKRLEHDWRMNRIYTSTGLVEAIYRKTRR